MNGLFADLRFALRQFGRRPAFYLLVAGILALGIGANVAMFTLADAALFRPLPVAEQDRVVRLFVSEKRDNPQFSNGSYPQYEDLAANKPGISDVAAFSDWAPFNVSLGAGEPQRVRGGLATGSFFDVLGLKAAAGRLIGRDDDRSFGGHPVAVLSHHYWRTRFEGAPDVVGRTIVVNRTPIQVIGVAPAGFTGLNLDQPVDMWLPMSMAATALPEQGREGMLRDRGFSWLDFVARVAPSPSRTARSCTRSSARAASSPPTFAAASASSSATTPDNSHALRFNPSVPYASTAASRAGNAR